MPKRHHDHLIDVRSGNVIEFRSDEIERLRPRIADRLGYLILEHKLELYGVPLDGDQVNDHTEPIGVRFGSLADV